MLTKAIQRKSKESVTRKNAGQKPSRTARTQKPHGMAGSLLNLQQTHGNRYVQQLLGGAVIQRKCACGGTCDHCRSENAHEGHETIQSILQHKGGGQPLEPDVRVFMESRFGEDFGGVKVHTDSHAAETSRHLNALAYTVGKDVFFDSGKYNPESAEGKQLLAHELTHVVQQSRGGFSPPLDPNSSHEQSADSVASSITAGLLGANISNGTGVGIARRTEETLPLAPNPYTGGTTSPASPSPTAAPVQGQTQQQQQTPPTRDLLGFSRSGFGRFSASLEPPDPRDRSAPCKLKITMRVKFNFPDTHGTWPPGRPQSWQKEFIELVQRHWSTRYLLVPSRPCQGEACTAAAVYVGIEPVTSGEHHEVNVYYRKPGGARSHAGIPDQTPAEFYEEDVRPRGGFLTREHTTAAHEAGHWLGLEHIFCDSGAWYCYGITAGQSDDVMGRGEFVSARDYEPFTEVMHDLTHCDWRTAGEHGGQRTGSFALALGILGALGGVALGLFGGFGVGAIIGLGALYGVLGGALGFAADVA